MVTFSVLKEYREDYYSEGALRYAYLGPGLIFISIDSVLYIHYTARIHNSHVDILH